MSPEDHERYDLPQNIENAARVIGVSPAMVRLAIDCGCPSQGDQVTPAVLTDWLCENLEEFRRMAALPRLPPAVDEWKSEFEKMGNLLLTIAEYQHSRSSTPRMKRYYGEWVRKLRAWLAQGPCEE